jgi:hypothetical protein
MEGCEEETESERSRILNRPFKEGFEKELAEYNICLLRPTLCNSMARHVGDC